MRKIVETMGLTGDTFFQLALRIWAEQDRAIAEEQKKQIPMFRKILNKYIILNDKKMIQVTREILKELGDKDDRACGTKDANRHIRYVVRPAEKNRGWARDEPKKPTNVEQTHPGIEPRKDVHYRWKDKPRKDDAGSTDSHGHGKTG